MHVVGHSLGGLVARYLVQRLGGDARVESLVTLGTPHARHALGARPARAAGPPAAPGLAADARAGRAGARLPHPVTAVYSDLDQVVVPTAAGRCDHPDLQARNVLVRGVGHMSLPIHRGVVDEVAATLAGRRSQADTPPPLAA